jgi:RNA recognition motif-containing protein
MILSIDAQIVKKQDRSKGFGFVTLKDEKDVAKAVETLHHKELQGREINVEHAKPMSERPKRVPKEQDEKENTGPADGTKARRKRKPKKKVVAKDVRVFVVSAIESMLMMNL